MDSSQKISRSPPRLAFARKQWGLIAVLVVIITPWIGGCGELLGTKPAEFQSEKIISDLSAIRITPEPNIPLPQIYKDPPKIVKQVVGGAEEWKLFYFGQYLASDELQAIVHELFATVLFNVKGKSTTIKDYKVISIRPTNQLIVRCPTREDIDAVLETLEWSDVPPVQVKIECIISEVYADKTLDRSTTIEILELFGENIALKPAGMAFINQLRLLVEQGEEVFPAFPGAVLRDVGRAKMGLKAGYLSDKFTALVDVLESHGYLKIRMNTALEVINGEKAKVQAIQKIPLQRITTERPQLDYVTTQFEYVEIVDSLEITPHVYFGDGSIGLKTKAVLSSKLTPEGVKQINIVTRKEIENEETRIRRGESLVIGGIRKIEERDVVRGFPILKDIPFLGMLFSGRDFEERAVETIFILTPTISTGGIPREEIVEELKRKHEKASPEALDPLGIKALEREHQRKAREAEEARLKAEAEKAKARHAVRGAEEKVKKAKAETERAKEKAVTAEKQAQIETEKAKAEIEKAKAEVEIAKADAQKAIAEAEKAKADVQKATAEAEKAKADAQKATAEAEKAKADAEKTKAEAERLAAETKKAKADAEKAKAEAEAKAKAEAERLAAETKKAKAEVEEKAKAETEAKAKAEAERLAAEAEAKAKRKAEAKAKRKARAQAKREAEAKAKQEAAENTEPEDEKPHTRVIPG